MADRPRFYRLSPLAEADLEDIWLYTVDNWSIEQAERYQAAIVAAFDALADGSRKGRSADIRNGYFKYAVGSHFIFYRQSPSAVDIIRVLHQRMDVSQHL